MIFEWHTGVFFGDYQSIMFKKSLSEKIRPFWSYPLRYVFAYSMITR